jgi:hypothetical protein
VLSDEFEEGGWPPMSSAINMNKVVENNGLMTPPIK